jgi:hypothetical protein
MLRTTLAIVALLLCLGLAAGLPRPDTLETELHAAGSGAVWKYTESGVTRYYFEAGDLRYGQWYNVYPPVQGNEHGTATFDLSPIPDTARVTAAEFGFFQYSDDTAGTPPCDLRGFDYTGQEPESLFAAVESGTVVAPEREAFHGWNRVPLNDVGVQSVQARLLGNSLHVAIRENAWGKLGYAFGTPAPESLRPYLLVSYLPTGVEESLKPQAARRTLRISPNPCRRSAVLHLTTGPLDHSTTLLIYDASGRIALSQPVRASSFILRTSSLPSGVYVARCTSGDRTSAARLVVER